MPPSRLQHELERVGAMLTRWQAELKLTFWAVLIMACLWVFSLSDVFVQFNKPGRIAAWTVLVALIGVTCRRVSGVMSRKRTLQAIAAVVERSFPQLDNHLINYIQFSTQRDRDVFRDAYVQRGLPEWRGIDPKDMKNRKAHRTRYIALSLAVALLVAPCLFTRDTWAVAVWRIVNPFSNCRPVSLTNITEVLPGSTSVPQGDPLLMICKVRGQKGHRVRLDLKPADDKTSTYEIGRLKGDGTEKFSYRVSKITTDVKYRFRAGDSPFPEWYKVEARPPLAFNKIALKVRPPQYTRIQPATYDGLGDDIQIPQGALVDIVTECNLPVSVVSAFVPDEEPVEFAAATGKHAMSGALTVTCGKTIKIVALDAYDERVETTVNFTLVPDRAPVIKVLAPTAATMLPPGAGPRIEFEVTDDYGLNTVLVERVIPGTAKTAPGATLESWRIGEKAEYSGAWAGKGENAKTGQPMAFRVVATDNYSADGQLSRSSTIVFNPVDGDQMAEKKESLESKAGAALAKIIEMQKENIFKTTRLQDVIDQAVPAQWHEIAAQQRVIRQITKELLGNPLKPLGNLARAVKKLYMNEMEEVIGKLNRLGQENEPNKPALAVKSLNLEQKILRNLTYSEVAANQTKVRRRMSELTGRLRALVEGERTILKTTASCVKKALPVSDALVDDQDDLAADLSEFIKSCRHESETIKGNDKTFADIIVQVAAACEDQKIRGDMLRASEQLEGDKPKIAMPHEKSALDKLAALYEKLNSMQADEAEDDLEEMVDVLEHAKKKMEKIRKLHKKAIASMEEVKSTLDKNEKDEDMMEEEYSELLEATKDALLEIPTDLHIFQELNVANELVEDVFSVFEEVEQEEGTEKQSKEDMKVLATAKREQLLEEMEHAEGRMDDIEQWLGSKPDDIKVVDEAFDQEEMPEAGMALGALATEAEDIIGDLLEEDQDEDADSEDGAINQAKSDMEFGKEITEGDISSFSAKGKSGNERPDHKEQDGRSNVGRQGMSVGETAAGSGTISEGDENIEKRRTQDPTQSGQVDLDGEADTKATGGGKQATGKADEYGMHGGGHRMDSTEAGSPEGMASLMAAKAESMYVKASMMNLRTGNLSDAAHHMRQASDAVAAGRPISEIKEHRRQAAVAMKKVKSELSAGVGGSIDDGLRSDSATDLVEGGSEHAPPKYRDMVAEYYKALNETM